MPLVYRSTVGRRLTVSEGDLNIFQLSESSGVSFVQSGSGALATDLQTRGRLVVYAHDFGTMTSTPGADINEAITKVNAAGGGTVIVSPGSYTIETSILQKSNVWLDLRGAILTAATGLNSPIIKNATAISSGTCTITRSARTATATKTGHGFAVGDWVFINGATQKKYNGAQQVVAVPTADTFTFYVEKSTTSPATGTINVYKAVETNLKVIGGELVGNAANTSGTNYGIYYHGVAGFRLEDVYQHGCYHMGIGIVSGVEGELEGCWSHEVIHTSHNGFLFGTTNVGPAGGATYCRNIDVIACKANLNGQTGYEFVVGHGFSMTNCEGDRNTIGGITANFASHLSIVNCRARHNSSHGIELFLTGGPEDISISDCICTENGDSGIQVTNQDTANTVKNISIKGNTCTYNDQAATTVAYGISFELAASTTIDTVVVQGNILRNNARGLSFGANGSVTNVTIDSNRISDNTANLSFGASLDLTTLIYDGELSFTPVLTFGGGSTGITYGAQTGRYMRKGGRVFFTITIWLTNKGSSAGSAIITGLPFTSPNTNNFGIAALVAGNLTFTGQVCAYVNKNAATIALATFATTGAVTALADTNFGNTSEIYLTGSYEVA